MTWFLFALLTAFFESLRDVFNKRALKDVNEYVVAWSLMFLTALFLSPILFFIDLPPLEKPFWVALGIGGVFNTISFILFIKALKLSDLSKVAPITTFTPLFLLVTSPLIVGEFPNLIGLVGVFLIVAGSYILNRKETHKGYLAPFQALLTETGSKFALLVAFLWSITSNFDKVGVQNSSPIFWVISSATFISLLMAPIVVLQKSRISPQHVRQGLGNLVCIGLFNAITVAFQMTAINLTLVAYVIAVKRTSALFSVAFGCLIFKERGIKARLTGSVIMVLGVALIALS